MKSFKNFYLNTDTDHTKNDEKWMKLALNEAELAMKNGEVPIASILVSNNKELSRSQTMVRRAKNPTAHGELFALLKVTDKILNAERPLIIYTTLEPCLMCLGATMQANIDEIVFGMKASPDGGVRYQEDIKKKGQKSPSIRGGVLEAECLALMKRIPSELSDDYVKKIISYYDDNKINRKEE